MLHEVDDEQDEKENEEDKKLEEQTKSVFARLPISLLGRSAARSAARSGGLSVGRLVESRC